MWLDPPTTIAFKDNWFCERNSIYKSINLDIWYNTAVQFGTAVWHGLD